jgi:hypothetical protein
MKKTLILFVLVLFSMFGYSQVTLLDVDFETSGNGYTPSATWGGALYTDVFDRINDDIPNTTSEDGYYWGVEDLSITNPSITLDQINVSGYSSFTFSIDFLAHHYDDWDTSDELLITYSIDGGAYQNLMWVQSIYDGDAFNSLAALDTDFDGDGECANKLPSITTGTNAGIGCTVSSSDFATFITSSITLSGNSTLDIKLQFNELTATDEGIYLDNIIIKGISSGPTISTNAIAGSPFCVTASTGAAVNVPYTSTGTFNAGNIYTAQLSNASGSFAAPTNIGTLSSTANSGTINATIPSGTTGGSGYRIHVISNNPAVTGSDNGSDLVVVLSPQNVIAAGITAGNTQVDIGWTNPVSCYDEILVVAKAGSVTATPSGNGSAYTPNALFGAGTNLGGANYCVYKGTGNSVTITGLTNGVNYCFKIFTRIGTTWSSGSEVCATPNVSTTTIFERGDIVVVGLCSNTITCDGTTQAGDDEMSFVCFQDITNGTTFEMTDNGWERCSSGLWGNAEGTIQVTRTGGTITAGTIITFRLHNNNTYECTMPDNNWTFTNINSVGSQLVLNSDGDQIYFMQGGTWNSGTAGNNDATYTGGEIIFGFNTNNTWTAGICSAANSGTGTGRSQNSGLIDGMECFHVTPGGRTDYLKYTGPLTPATRRVWIQRMTDYTTNWTSYTDCINYYAQANPHDYHNGGNITVTVGGYASGKWIGVTDTDWFECSNWENLRVPDNTVDVLIPTFGVTFEPTIGDPTITSYSYAECNDINLQSGRTLTLNHTNSRLDVSGDITFDGTVLHTNGIVRVIDDASVMNAAAMISFYNFEIAKNIAANSFSIDKDMRINNNLILTLGKIATNTNWVFINNTSIAAIIGGNQNSYIYGNLRRNVSATGAYNFPVGSSAFWEDATLTLNSSSGISYIDAFFTTPHTTPINISGLGLTIGGTLLEELLDYGFWTISPNAYTSVNYDIEISSYAHTNAGTNPEDHAVIKRPNTASNWVSQGTHNNTTQSMAGGYVTAIRTSLTVFSDFAIAKANTGALPVELLSFTATPKNQEVVLKWATASEVNNDYFTIERSSNAIHFYDLANIQGAGNSNIEMKYQTIDNNALKGISYYRLRQTDFDGSISYSDIETVNINSSDELRITQPFSNNNQIQFYVYNAQGISLVEIYDITGRLLFNEEVIVSDNIISIPNTFSKGTYVLKLTNQAEIRVKKFVL